jgi:hypothetical protein
MREGSLFKRDLTSELLQFEVGLRDIERTLRRSGDWFMFTHD